MLCRAQVQERTTRSTVERVSHQEAAAEQQRVIEAIQLSYDEVSPFDHGGEIGAGRSQGVKEGRTEGYQQGHSDGRSEGVDQGYREGFDSGVWQGRDQGAIGERARILREISE
jgi:flagellar biosynthesis/type III secretory pathway protein FliH